MKSFLKDCLDQTVRAVFWAFVIALVIGRVFLGTAEALSTAGTVTECTAPVFLLASVALTGIRRLTKNR